MCKEGITILVIITIITMVIRCFGKRRGSTATSCVLLGLSHPTSTMLYRPRWNQKVMAFPTHSSMLTVLFTLICKSTHLLSFTKSWDKCYLRRHMCSNHLCWYCVRYQGSQSQILLAAALIIVMILKRPCTEFAGRVFLRPGSQSQILLAASLIIVMILKRPFSEFAGRVFLRPGSQVARASGGISLQCRDTGCVTTNRLISSPHMKMLRGTWPRMGSSSWPPWTSLCRRWTQLSTRRWRTPSALSASTRSPGWNMTRTEATWSTMLLHQKLRSDLFRLVPTVCIMLLQLAKWTRMAT